jgi:hypothetical protein
MGAFSGFLGGLANGAVGKKAGQDQFGSPPSSGTKAAPQSLPADLGTPTGTGIQAGVAVPEHGWQSTVPSQNPANAQQPINTQTGLPHSGFNGLIPMIGNYIQNHQAKANDAQAQTHVQALQTAGLTPEQRQYHISALQQLYKNRPDVLQQMGIPAAPGGYNVPSVATPPPVNTSISSMSQLPTGGK